MRSMPSIETLMDDQIDTPSEIGLVSQRNWLAAIRGNPQSGVSEYPLNSDAHITGEFVTGLGPYCFLNTVPLPSSVGTVNAPIIVRVSEHIGPASLPIHTVQHGFPTTFQSTCIVSTTLLAAAC